MRRLSRAWPLAVLALVLAATFGPAIAQGLLLAPNDGLAQYFPERVMAAASWRQGEVPFWNPYIFGGMPLMAAMQAGVLFPGNMPFLVLPPVAAMNLTVLLAYMVAGAGAYAFGRALAMPRPAALLTGLVYMLGGFMIAHLEHVVVVQAAGLLPWLLFAIERARSDRRYAPLGALMLGLMLLAGHPQTAVFGLGVAIAYGLYRAAGAPWPYARALGLLLLLGVGLSLLQLLPTWELSRLTDRSALSYSQLVEMSLPPRQILTLLFPFLFGGVPTGLYPTPYWGAGLWPNELIGYVGLPTLLLAGWALRGLRRQPYVAFFAALAALGLILALGGSTPLYRLWSQVPVLNTMRVPGRHLLEVHLALSVLAGLGLARLMAADASERCRQARLAALGLGAGLALAAALLVALGPALARRWQAFLPEGVDLAGVLSPLHPALWVPLALGCLLLAAAWALRDRGAWVAAMLVLSAGDLWLFAQHVGWRQHSPTLAAVPESARLEDYRTASLAAGAYPYRDAELVRALRYPVTGSLWGVRAVGGYDPLMPSRYAKLMGHVAHSGHLALPALWQPAHHGLDLLGARRIVVESGLATPPCSHFRLLAEEERVRVYENPRAMPMAWRPALAEVLSPEDVDALVTAEPDFDPRTTVLLESPLAIPRVAPGLASVERHSPSRMTVSTRGAGPGVVVVSEAFDPGWRATLDGRPLPVHRVNGLLIGIEVPAGAHRLALTYEPRLWKAGLAGSALSLAALLVWWRRPRRPGMSGTEGAPDGRTTGN